MPYTFYERDDEPESSNKAEKVKDKGKEREEVKEKPISPVTGGENPTLRKALNLSKDEARKIAHQLMREAEMAIIE